MYSAEHGTGKRKRNDFKKCYGEEAVEMTSYNASKYLNLNDVGIIKEGYKSNFLILDKNYNIKNVYLKGNKIGE